MIYSPHTLQIKKVTAPQKDEFGRPVPGSGGEQWVEVCRCRCDDVSAEKRISVNGAVYDFKYKVVFSKHHNIETDTEVRCVDEDGSIRGQGIAKSPMKTNLLSYKVIWLE